jgi:anti-sigma factor (TIGR02949 family)
MQNQISETCKELIAQMSDFLDGDLDAGLCEKIERHLAACPDCRTLADTLQKTLTLYRGARADMPRDAHAHLIQALGLDTFNDTRTNVSPQNFRRPLEGWR